MDEPRTQRIEPITERQLEVARLIAAGRTNPEIAEDLGVTLAGAKYHVSELLGRLGLQRREEIAAWYREQRGTPLTRARRRVRALGVGPLLAWGGGAVAAVVVLAALVVALDGAREGGAGGAAGTVPTPSVEEPIDVLHIDDLPVGTVRTFELTVDGLVERPDGVPEWRGIDASPYGFHLARLENGEVRAYWWHDTHLGYRTFWSKDDPWPEIPGESEFVDPDGMFYSRHATYNIEGRLIMGPGQRHFERFAVDVRDDGRMWVDLSQRVQVATDDPAASDATPTPNTSSLLFDEYEVQAGDTWEVLASRLAMDVAYLRWNNPWMANVDPQDGTTIRVPVVEGIIHSVLPNDRVHSLARHYGVEAEAILNFPGNGLDGNIDNLRSGMIIIIPGGRPPESQ